MKQLLTFVVICATWFAANIPFETRGCTSWMVFSDLTKNNTNILHKNRDSKSRNIIAFMSKPEVKRKWVALGNTPEGVNAGMNSSGLAGVMNSGGRCIDPPNKGKKGYDTTVMMRIILESCDTAEQAVAKLKELVREKKYNHGDKGSIFFFCDTKEGYVCEMTAEYCSSQQITRGFTVRANVWHNPNMYELNRNTLGAHLHSAARMYMAISLLNKAIDENKKITVSDSFEISRHFQMPETSAMKRSLCGLDTNASATLEIDREYPDVLSTLYVTIGPPRNTIYMPLPICAEKLHPAMSNYRWSEAAWKHFEALSFKAAIAKEWSEFEAAATAKVAKAKVEARKLLKSGKRAEAVKLINSTAETLWDEAAALLKISK